MNWNEFSYHGTVTLGIFDFSIYVCMYAFRHLLMAPRKLWILSHISTVRTLSAYVYFANLSSKVDSFLPDLWTLCTWSLSNVSRTAEIGITEEGGSRSTVAPDEGPGYDEKLGARPEERCHTKCSGALSRCCQKLCGNLVLDWFGGNFPQI